MKVTPGSTDISRIEPASAERTTAARPRAAAAVSADTSSTIRISDLSSRLAALETRITDGATFDAGRVEAIKSAIRDGQFKVNAEVVADRLITSVRELLAKAS